MAATVAAADTAAAALEATASKATTRSQTRRAARKRQQQQHLQPQQPHQHLDVITWLLMDLHWHLVGHDHMLHELQRQQHEGEGAWLLDYQKNQADDHEDQERQRLDREQADREVKLVDDLSKRNADEAAEAAERRARERDDAAKARADKAAKHESPAAVGTTCSHGAEGAAAGILAADIGASHAAGDGSAAALSGTDSATERNRRLARLRIAAYESRGRGADERRARERDDAAKARSDSTAAMRADAPVYVPAAAASTAVELARANASRQHAAVGTTCGQQAAVASTVAGATVCEPKSDEPKSAIDGRVDGLPSKDNPAASPIAAEPAPDINMEHISHDVENAKRKANGFFSQGNFEDAVKWFSKGICLVESNKVMYVPSDLHSILHSNRAMAHIKLKSWSEAESDCTAALVVNLNNTKARYRRAMARHELGKTVAALEDLDQVLNELPDPSSNKEVLELKQQITEQLQYDSAQHDDVTTSDSD